MGCLSFFIQNKSKKRSRNNKGWPLTLPQQREMDHYKKKKFLGKNVNSNFFKSIDILTEKIPNINTKNDRLKMQVYRKQFF